MSEPRTIVWFRRDLRLHDNPALAEAATRGVVIPLFIWAPEEDGAWPPGGASRWWLHHALAALDGALRERGSRLIVRRGPSARALAAIAEAAGATAVTWNRLPERAAIERDAAVEKALGRHLQVSHHNAALLFEPTAIRTAEGRAFSVFTPFWRACLTAPEPPAPLPVPGHLRPPARWPVSLSIDELGLDPRHPWTNGLAQTWDVGEAAARAKLRALPRKLAAYPEDRDRPDRDGTSALSPHLHHGELGPRQVWHALARHDHGAPFLRELGWREFAHHALQAFPALPDQPVRAEFRRFGWQSSTPLLRAWQKGQTGYPLVDAGMSQLWTTGWMHNRVRMVVGSFLVKHLLCPWQDGERWFWDTLVDADLANNALNWQWVAGTGPDAAPFFRIFNPVIQSKKFDPAGDYIRRWVPELAGLSGAAIHEPWKSPVPGYPPPIVEHSFARERALALFGDLRASAG
jgi:deoxyribodipyrimidine photo-lyase